jgi:site-specific DNA-adenine methylase
MTSFAELNATPAQAAFLEELKSLSGFTEYQAALFMVADHERLREEVARLQAEVAAAEDKYNRLFEDSWRRNNEMIALSMAQADVIRKVGGTQEDMPAPF